MKRLPAKHLGLVAHMGAIFCMVISSVSWAGSFEGKLNIYPPGCQTSPGGICKLGSPLTYRSSRNSLVWKTVAWQSDKAESGTTDGASIPKWAQNIIGIPYDQTYLKAAIIHDHYCYKENQVRPWRETHRMFYDAMIDLDVPKSKAKTMYYAVYLAGPKWVKLVKGEKCGKNCLQKTASRLRSSKLDNFSENSLLYDPKYQAEVLKLYKEFENGAEFSIEELEERAKAHDKSNFFFAHGDTYSPRGKNDPNLQHRL